MAPEVALAALNELPTGSLVLDPMAGSGVVLRAAADSGHRAIGIDTDPLAVLMASVWTTPIDVHRLLEALEEILGTARDVNPSEVNLPWIDEDAAANSYVNYWFAPQQQADLRRLVASLPATEDAITQALRLGVSRIIVTKDHGASLARDVSHSRPHKVTEHNSYDVLHGFERAVRRMARILEEEPPVHGAEIHRGDARALVDVDNNTVSAVITSPPYLNAIDYIRGHRLALIWLGLTISELRSIRSENVGAERAADVGNRSLRDLQDEIPAISQLPLRLQRMVLRYRHDLAMITEQIARVLVLQGRAVFVIGNSTIRGVFLDNAELLTRAAADAGLHCVDQNVRELPGANRYLPPPGSGIGDLSRRMREEVVLSFAFREACPRRGTRSNMQQRPFPPVAPKRFLGRTDGC